MHSMTVDTSFAGDY